MKKYLYTLMFLFVAIAVYGQNYNLKLISPNGSEKLIPGNRYSISWIANDVDWISIYYRLNDSTEWEIITERVSGSLGSFSWEVPHEQTENLKIKIQSNTIYDISEDYVFIRKKLRKSTIIQEVNAIRIMPLGNSITFDNRKNDTRVVEDKIGYRFPLYNLLLNAGYTFNFIGSEHAGSNFFSPNTEFDKNAGFPGIKDDQLFTLLNSGRRYQPQNGIDQQITNGRYLNTYPADIILLHIGTNGNDLGDGTEESDIENILDEIDAYEDSNGSEVIVFLCRIINRVPNESFVSTLNDNVVDMALDRVNNSSNDAYPDKIVIVDMENISDFNYTINPDPNGSPGDMNDQLHANDKGYSKIAEQWFNSLTEYLGNLPEIITQPLPVAAIEGEDLKFSVTVSSSLPLSFQWTENGSDIIGETDSILIITDVESIKDSNVYKCVVSNILGTVVTDEVDLIVTPIENRVTRGLQIAFGFNEQYGNNIADISNIGDSLNLFINSNETFLWTPGGIEIYDESNISETIPSKKVFENFTNTSNPSEISFELWIKPKTINQSGPARIVTFSNNKFERNYGILQNGDKYEVRLRTTSTDDNGLPSLSSPNGSVVEKLTQLVYTFSRDDTSKIYLDGVLNSIKYLGGSFGNWDSTFAFGISNEFLESKPWLGKINHIGIFNRELHQNEILHNYTKGVDGINVEINPPNDVTLTYENSNMELAWNDNSPNESAFIIRRKAGLLSNYVIIDQVNENNTEYTDLQVVEGTKYFYALSASNMSGESDISNIGILTTRLSEPINLTASNTQDFVELSWEDVSNNEAGYIIEGKANLNDSLFQVIDTVSSNVVRYVDTKVKYYSPYVYRVYAFTQDTTSNYSEEFSLNVVSVDENDSIIPTVFDLQQNFPNPFNPSTIINYSIPELSSVSLIVYNVLGQPVMNLLSGQKKPGQFSLILDASELSSGVYFYRMNAKGHRSNNWFTMTKKFLLLK